MSWSARAVLFLPLLLFFDGCASAPPQAFPTAQAVAQPGMNIALLARGRKIFTTSCTECHVARRVADYSVSQWRQNIAVMAPRARLRPVERAALEAYLVAARESLP